MEFGKLQKMFFDASVDLFLRYGRSMYNREEPTEMRVRELPEILDLRLSVRVFKARDYQCAQV